MRKKSLKVFEENPKVNKTSARSWSTRRSLAPGEPHRQWHKEKCSELFPKTGFLFSKEELNFWQKQPHFVDKDQNKFPVKGRNVSHRDWNIKPGMVPNQNHMADQSAYKRLRQPQSSMAEQSVLNFHEEFQGMASHQTGKIALKNWESQWQNSFIPGKHTRLWQPPVGSVEQNNGKVCHGISPCWAHLSAGQAMLQTQEPQGPFYQRLRQRIPWWEKNTRNPEVLGLILNGVPATYSVPSSLSKVPCVRSREETKMALETIQEYLEVGAVKEINWHQAKHLIPWFVIKRGEKLRLITNCKEINQFLEPKPFRLENWAEIFPYLRKGMWAAKIDLKHAYFHLGIAEALKPYMCIQVEDKVYQFQAACFGLSTLPQQWQSVMKVFLKKWRKQGLLTWVYLDDILVVGHSPQAVQKHLQIMLQDLEFSGMVINKKKSQLEPTQKVEHLGFSVDLKNGVLQVPQEKLKAIQKELGKLLTNKEMSCRKMAAILGATRAFLMAMPFLRAFTDQMVQSVNHCFAHPPP